MDWVDKNILWNTPPNCLQLPRHEVHVWLANFATPTAAADRFAPLLSRDEKEQAERFHFVRDQVRYATCRGILRTLLGRYLEKDPAALQFSYNPYGKPLLEPASGGEELDFNLSHSDELALFAFTRNRRVGVDLERMRSRVDSSDIAKSHFIAREVAALRATPAHDREKMFFRLWTCKEAYIKAEGRGLSLPVDQCEVTLCEGAHISGRSACWLLREVTLSDAVLWTDCASHSN